MKFPKLIAASFAFLCVPLFAQNSDPLVFTVGQTYSTNGNTTRHNYLLWQPGDAATTFGKRFAVYAKDGVANDSAPYTRVSIQKLQTSPSAIQALLKLGDEIDADQGFLPMRITALHAEAQAQPLPSAYVFPTEIDAEVAQRLAQVMEVASGDPEVLQSLVSLGRAHPGVMMAMGHAFSIQVSPTSVKTYEVREVTAGNQDVRVIGRVTLDAATPYSLLAPGRPFPNPHPVEESLQLVASGKDHLNVRLRWGLSDAFRETFPKTYGFNLYRVPKANALSPNLITTAEDAVAKGIRVNELPVSASDLFTDAEAGDLSVKREVFFYADDKNPPGDPFVDGEQFYYYVAARDIAGHTGPLSPPTLITMCDRLPPSQAAILSVDNIFDMENAEPGAGKGKQNLRVIIRQVPETPAENRAFSYLIYRWHSATDWQRHGGDPDFNLIGEVKHVKGKYTVYFDDNDPGDIDTDYVSAVENGPDTGSATAQGEGDFNMGKTFWYTVRAVDDVACDPKNLSGHCGAMYGVLRDRVGPPKPEGTIIRCFCTTEVLVDDLNKDVDDLFQRVDKTTYDLNPDFPGFVVRVTREDDENQGKPLAKVAGFEIEVGTREDPDIFTAKYSRIHFFQGAAIFGDLIVPLEDRRIGEWIRVRSRLVDGTTSSWRYLALQGNSGPDTSIQIYGFLTEVEGECEVILPDAVDVFAFAHQPEGLDGKITGVCGTVETTATVHEVRVYRRIGHTSPLQLIFKTAGNSLPATVDWKEAAPILVNGIEACYFAQVLDEHGNASALVRLGCVMIQNADLGTPLLADPQLLAPVGNLGELTISWFSDPVGVERFELWAADESASELELVSANLSGKLSTMSNPVLTTPDGDELSFCVFQSGTLASGFGTGGEFEATIKVPTGRKIYYAVRAVGPMVNDGAGNYHRVEGPFSNLVFANYTIPGDPLQPVIPWPDRPLPGVAGINQNVDAYQPGEGPFYAQALTPANMNNLGASGLILVGRFPAPIGGEGYKNGQSLFPGQALPSDWLFSFRKQASDEQSSHQLESIRRFVVYRHQIISDRFPNAKPNLVQITPLIDKLTYYVDPLTQLRKVDDPFFIFMPYTRTLDVDAYVPSGGQFTRNPNSFSLLPVGTGPVSQLPYLKIADRFNDGYVRKTMWVKDHQPVTKGANYQYLIVHFGERGEIDRVIPTNIISH